MKTTPSSSSGDDFSIDKKFQAAVEIVHSLPRDGPVTTTTDEKLAFYSLYKQATVGPCNTCQPRFWNIVEKFKWDAWNNLGTMEPTEAKKNYVSRLLRKIIAASEELDDEEWIHSELYEQLVPKFAILGLQPADSTSKNYDLVDGTDVNDSAEHSREGDRGVEDNTVLESGCSDVEYVDARDEQYLSRVSSPANQASEPKACDRGDSELRNNATPSENKSEIRLIPRFNVVADHRCATIKGLFRKATILLMAMRGISWKTVVILIVWPFVANMLVKIFRNLIGV